MTTFANRLPTGPGSRGGRWAIDREFRNEYQRAWRAAHPEYREREARRSARKRRDLPSWSFSELLLSMVADEVAAGTSVRRLALELGISHTTVSRYLNGVMEVGGDAMNALVDRYGLPAIARHEAVLQAEERINRRTGGSSSAGTVPATPVRLGAA